ncbi:hypothetical protein O4H53_06175 [Sulfitobacter sp. G21635-S1]|uniref:hypothetical protein n=1 Tax=Sulfitobacter sp. G21635-S1 TaxID=3014043 RepID=UPI0022AF794A|nr:hypothetical protein [Sulfitobacter sp. G21635-S1]MCZ4255116.1 hypothetical protein [Sulfitobacter sp. G21635-S1]
MTKIEFLCPPDLLGRIPAPQSAAKFLPEWFRDLDREMDMKDAHGLPGLTVRACLPVADVMAQGWIIPTPFDIWTVVDPQTRAMEFRWASDLPFAPIDAHHPGQIGAEYPPFEGAQPLKLINPWRVVLPPGWSASFLHPVNHFELPFAEFNGTVDCDALDVPVNVPFLWTSTRGALRMPAGTPMVQVIPFERAAQMRQAEVRAETAGEQARRQAANSRKHSEESVYAREWRRRHEKSPSG